MPLTDTICSKQASSVWHMTTSACRNFLASELRLHSFTPHCQDRQSPLLALSPQGEEVTRAAVSACHVSWWVYIYSEPARGRNSRLGHTPFWHLCAPKGAETTSLRGGEPFAPMQQALVRMGKKGTWRGTCAEHDAFEMCAKLTLPTWIRLLPKPDDDKEEWADFMRSCAEANLSAAARSSQRCLLPSSPQTFFQH